MTELLAKKIKRDIYGKPQSVKAAFPAGFGKVALDEVSSILNSLWFPQKLIGECSLIRNEIRIYNIHLFSITELLMRSQCLSDISLILFEGKSFGKSAFEKQCREIPWNYYVNKKMSARVKINSVASKAFHETGLKEILTDILREYCDIVSGDDSTTCISADLYKNKLTLSISLNGDLLYKRGYRSEFNANAPLREDAASCCIQKVFQSQNQKDSSDLVLIPFAGTGTFAFEYLQFKYQFPPVLFGRKYALQEMPFFKQENFNYLIKKAKENIALTQHEKIHVLCLDPSEKANSALSNNLINLKSAFVSNHFDLQNVCSFENLLEDFFQFPVSHLASFNHIFIPLNPPYGIRLNKDSDSIDLYKKIAIKINQITVEIKKKKQAKLLGFVLCPSEETWKAFFQNLKGLLTDTYHFTQGGIDIRVCQFYVKP